MGMKTTTTIVMMSFLCISALLTQLYAIHLPLKATGSSKNRPDLVIFHPPTGLCVLRTFLESDLKLGSCEESDGWEYTRRKTLEVVGMYSCLQVDDLGRPVKLIVCTGSNSKWDVASDEKTYLISKFKSGEAVCLDSDAGNTVVTTACKCLNSDRNCDPASQWFKLVEKTSV